MISSASEVARLLDGLFSGRLLGPAMRSEMIQAVPVPVAHPLIRKPGYGLGLMMDLASPYGLVAGHGGGGPGYSTAAFQFENVSGHRLTCVALANRDCADLGLRIAFAIAAWYAQEGR